jgi:hypothetical protein
MLGSPPRIAAPPPMRAGDNRALAHNGPLMSRAGVADERAGIHLLCKMDVRGSQLLIILLQRDRVSFLPGYLCL